MEFRVLGPLEIARDGAIVRLPGRISVRLLAVLLLDAGRVVPVDRLVAGVWDGEPPATAPAQVRNTAVTLRKHLGKDRLEHVAGGYRLSLRDATVDARRFGEAVHRAQALIADGDRAAALRMLRDGLALWRGNAFEGLAGRVIDAAAANLHESRWSAKEDRIALELDLGEPAPVIGELRQLVAEHPYRQRPTGLLMLALYRDGRAPEAVEVYEELRARLARDLGLDPDARLQQRHAAILRRDPGLDAPADTSPDSAGHGHGAGGPAHRVPTQLPPRPAGFVGRDDYLSTLYQQLDDPGLARSCVIAGSAGAGKTALAVHWAHQVRDRFPDGQLFVNLRGFDTTEPVTVADAAGRFIRALQDPSMPAPSTTDEAIAHYRSLLAGKRILVVLDNAGDVSQVRDLLPPGDTGFAIVTSRHKLPGLTALNDSRPMGLAPLTRGESVELVINTAQNDLLPFDDANLDLLASLCGDLP
ncbi:MAG: BTAD domain-containing putative transcriptional regulator, partial [Stackebrandtia sp.]